LPRGINNCQEAPLCHSGASLPGGASLPRGLLDRMPLPSTILFLFLFKRQPYSFSTWSCGATARQWIGSKSMDLQSSKMQIEYRCRTPGSLQSIFINALQTMAIDEESSPDGPVRGLHRNAGHLLIRRSPGTEILLVKRTSVQVQPHRHEAALNPDGNRIY